MISSSSMVTTNSVKLIYKRDSKKCVFVSKTTTTINAITVGYCFCNSHSVYHTLSVLQIFPQIYAQLLRQINHIYLYDLSSFLQNIVIQFFPLSVSSPIFRWPSPHFLYPFERYPCTHAHVCKQRYMPALEKHIQSLQDCKVACTYF